MFKKKRPINKFCPVCGMQLKIDDSFCIKCGYSFQNRKKKSRGIKWKNIMIVLIVLLLIYIGIRYSNNEPILPQFLKDIFNFTKAK